MQNNQKFYLGVLYGAIFSIILYIIVLLSYPYFKKDFKEHAELVSQGLSAYPGVVSSYQKALAHSKDPVIYLFGTSESGTLATRPRYNNYWHLLNQYYDNKIYFSSLGGAGHTPLMWANNILNMPPQSDVYYIVNPIYFTGSLNTFDSIKRYSKRYLSKESWTEVLNAGKALNLETADAFLRQLSFDDLNNISLKKEIAYYLNSFKNWLLTLNKKATEIHTDRLTLQDLDNTPLDPDIDPKYNVASWILKERDHSNQGNVKTPDDLLNSPRFQELLLIKKLADERNINLNFILMPPNKNYFEQYHALYPAQYEQFLPTLKKFLCNSNNCIDLNTEQYQHIFVDSMHLNGYGAAQIAIAIINDITKKENNND